MPRLRSKIFTFLNRIVTITEDKSNHILKYDIDNLLPQRIIRQVGESGTATSCISALNQYTFAYGLVDENVGKTFVNKHQTMNDLIKEMTPYANMFSGVTLHVSRKIDGTIDSVTSIPFEYVRKSTSGNFIYNNTYSLSGKYDKEKDVIYPPYRGIKIDQGTIENHIKTYGKDRGEILYFFNKKPGQYDYPISDFYSAISDIDTDAENSKYELESVNNSFQPSSILTFVGDIDDKNPDDKGNTEWDEIEETLEGFTGNKKDVKGETGRLKLAVFHAPTKEQIPVLQKVDNEGILNAVEASTKRVAKKVARAFGVPDFLVNLGDNVGFASNIIADQITLFNNRVNMPQELICKALKLIYPELPIELTQFTPIKYIDPLVMQDLTPTERRALYGYKTDETKSNSTVSLAQTLGVGGTQSLVSILQDTILSPDQKTNALEILFNITHDNAVKLVGTNTNTNAIPAAGN